MATPEQSISGSREGNPATTSSTATHTSVKMPPTPVKAPNKIHADQLIRNASRRKEVSIQLCYIHGNALVSKELHPDIVDVPHAPNKQLAHQPTIRSHQMTQQLFTSCRLFLYSSGDLHVWKQHKPNSHLNYCHRVMAIET